VGRACSTHTHTNTHTHTHTHTHTPETSVYKISVRKPEGKRQLGRPKLRWKDTSKMGIKQDIRRWIGTWLSNFEHYKITLNDSLYVMIRCFVVAP
jgi:hypothetical protein